MKKLGIIFALVIAPFVGAQNPPAWTGAVAYGIQSAYAPAPVTNLGPWIFSRFHYLVAPGVAGYDLSPYRGPNNMWAGYFGGDSVYYGEIYGYLYPAAAAYGFTDPEGLLLHYNIDNPPYSTITNGDMFDYA